MFLKGDVLFDRSVQGLPKPLTFAMYETDPVHAGRLRSCPRTSPEALGSRRKGPDGTDFDDF